MKQARPITVNNGRLVLPDGVREGAIRLVDGRIAALGDVAPEEGDEVVHDAIEFKAVSYTHLTLPTKA